MGHKVQIINEDFFNDTDITFGDDMFDTEQNDTQGKISDEYTCCFELQAYSVSMKDEIDGDGQNIYKLKNYIGKIIDCLSFVDDFEICILSKFDDMYLKSMGVEFSNECVDITQCIDAFHPYLSSRYGKIVQMFTTTSVYLNDEDVFPENNQNKIWIYYKFHVYIKPTVVSLRKLYISIVNLLRGIEIKSEQTRLVNEVVIYKVSGGEIDLNNNIPIYSNDHMADVVIRKIYKFIFDTDSNQDEDICEIVEKKYKINQTIRGVIDEFKINIYKWGYRIFNIADEEQVRGSLPVVVVDVLPETTTREYIIKTVRNCLRNNPNILNSSNKFNICFRFWPLKKSEKIEYNEYQSLYSIVWQNYTYMVVGTLASNGRSIKLKNINTLSSPLHNIYIAFPQADGSLTKAKLSKYTHTSANGWMNKLFRPQENPEKYFFEEQNV